MKLGLCGSHRDPQQLGDLPVFVPFHVMEDEYLARSVRQTLHARLQLDGQIGSRTSPRSAAQGVLGIRRDPLAAHAEPLAAGQDDVDGDPVKPGAEGRLAPEGVQLLPCPDEHVLRHLIGQVRPEHATDQAVYTGDVSAVQALECREVTSAGKACVVAIVTAGWRQVGLLDQGDARFHAGFDVWTR